MSKFIRPVHWLTSKTVIGPEINLDVPRQFIRVSKGDGGRVDGLHRGGIHGRGRGQNVEPHLPVGVCFEGSASNWAIKYCKMEGFTMEAAVGRYVQGDGFSSERGNKNLGFAFSEAYNNSDRGFDLKGPNTILRDCIAGYNSRNFANWDSAYYKEKVTSLTPTKSGPGRNSRAHFWFSGRLGPITIRIDKLIVRSEVAAPLFAFDTDNVTVIVEAHDIQTPRGTPLAENSGNIIWKTDAPKL